MNDLIRCVDLKLARADSQVRTLADEMSAWTSRNPITARVEFRENQLGFRLIVEDFVQTAPLDNWGLLIGECVHNLRTAFDNLAFALARLRHDPPRNPGGIAFPIYKDKSDFKKQGLRKLDQMPSDAAALIESFQPFQRTRTDVLDTPDRDCLVLLQWLNNTDKHRVPSVVLIAPTEISHAWAAKFHSAEDAEANGPPDVTVSGDPLESGSVILEYRTNRPIDTIIPNSQVKAIVAMQTMGKLMPVVETLRKLCYYTALVVEHFRRFFK